MLTSLASDKLFPTKWSFFIFVSYMTLFINQGLLITSSRQKGSSSYPYNPTLAILASEILKLLISLFVQGHSKGVSHFWANAYDNKKLLGYYFIPSFLYAIYNNLTFYNLSLFDPTTYFILLQIRLLLTGLVYQVLFEKYLSKVQWLALLLLTLGCMIQRADLSSPQLGLSNLTSKGFELLFILLQAFCSVFAGVYNEYIIKTKGAHVDISLQNVYMYTDSIVSNLMFMLCHEDLNLRSFFDTMWTQQILLWIIVNNALIGLVTALFLKNLNSILKAFASALEIIFTAFLGQLFLGIPIKTNTSIAIVVVSTSIVIYANNPISSTKAIEENTKKSSMMTQKV